MDEPALSIPDLARTAAWGSIRADQKVVVAVAPGMETVIELSARPTRLGQLYHLLCPRCGSRRRDLYLRDAELACRKCHRILHPDQRLSSSRWNRDVTRPCRQISRIDARLSRSGLDRNLRRRLRRRRARLLEQVQSTLARRRIGFTPDERSQAATE